ncbi:spore germination protein [Alkalihalobacterium chitinilyticum]|uniref:Spore germination protein n=1 Tax=Alkalihalobacterium chitinilyticum TaxID=2980103 RepID=A0ABT5VDQ4_9BACI|nr:spore germination protein [Alkalihalobacterium chitinilyticum]MDE5413587.1 spore germination protein [Alkalihalobacterium chitinilyticum]
MPAIVFGPFKINANDGNISFGDVLNMSPKSASKSVIGSGSAHTGDFMMTWNGINMNNAFDPDAVDQNVSGNQ